MSDRHFSCDEGKPRQPANGRAGSGKEVFWPSLRQEGPACAIVAVGSYPPTPLAETPRPSRRRWRARDCLGPNVSRRVGGVSPLPLGRSRWVLWWAALARLHRAAASARSGGVLGRLPTP